MAQTEKRFPNYRAAIVSYLREKREAQVATLALETEYPAGTYHIHLYDLREMLAWIQTLTDAEILRIFRYKDGLRLRPLTVAADTSENREKTRNLLMYQLVHDRKLSVIYSQDSRIKAEDVERITADILSGRENNRKRHRFDVSTKGEFGKVECKGMGGMFANGNEKFD